MSGFIGSNKMWLSALISSGAGGLLTVLSIYGNHEYGIAVFLLLPLFMGFCATSLYSYKNPITRRESSLVGFLALSFYSLGLLICAIEGLICIVMAAPIALAFCWLGSTLGYYIIGKRSQDRLKINLLLLGLFPLVSLWDRKVAPELTSVSTSVEISASKEIIWQNLVGFPQLDEPTELLFKAGIAYPTHATIEGKGVGAVRHCNFTTGSFVEPITIWDEPNLLKFSVKEQPASMRELSFWDINAPHLHDYFVSKQGQFKLTELDNGKVLLEGTTWYYHDIKPEFYWQIWSNMILHKIHQRVLNHIKNNAEKQYLANGLK